MQRHPDADLPVETMWEGDFIVARRKGRWEYVGRPEGIRAAVIIAIDAGHIILVEQYRMPLDASCIELPAGLVGDHAADEALEDAAARELEEETGFRAGHIDIIGEFASSPGMVSETFTLVRATKLEKVGDGGGVDNENIVVHRVAMADVSAFVERQRRLGKIMDVKLLLLLGAGILQR